MADATPALFWRGKADRQHLGTTPVRPHRLHGLSISRCLRYAARRLALVSTPWRDRVDWTASTPTSAERMIRTC